MNMGGLVGCANSTNISNCFASGKITGIGMFCYVGGLVGALQTNSSMSNCFAFNPEITFTSPTNSLQRIAGSLSGSNITLENNYAICSMTINGEKIPDGEHDNKDGADITSADATTQATYTTSPHSWDFNTTWTFGYSPNYNVVTTAGIATNLPVLQAFNKTKFPSALQPPHVNPLSCLPAFEIWNWADLAYVRVLTRNGQLGNYEQYLLMQDLFHPDSIGNYPTTGTGCTYDITAAIDSNRRKGCYGYENWINATLHDNSAQYLKYGLGTGQLLGEPAWDATGKGWIPIGHSIAPHPQTFHRVFDGQNHQINELWIKDYPTNASLFGAISYATIKNLGITILDSIIGQGGVAGLASNSTHSTIVNCHVTGGTVKAMGEYAYAGGLIGTVSQYDTIRDCYATCNVQAKGRYFHKTGGLIGEATELFLFNCYATGNVMAEYNTGGLIGFASGVFLSNCYATGNVTGFSYTGGLIGTGSGTTLSNCYASGSVTGQNYVGGLVGGHSYDFGTISNCFAFNPQITATGDSVGRIIGLIGTMATQQNNYAVCMPINGTKVYAGAHDNKNGADISYTEAITQSTYTTSPHSWNFGSTWTLGYSPNYNVVTTAGIETNLPVLQVFTKTAFPNARQNPHVDSLSCEEQLPDIHTQVVTCFPSTPINVVRQAAVACPSANISGSSKLGAGLSYNDSSIIYTHSQLGRDTVEYTLICATATMRGTIYLHVIECPDNILDPNCYEHVDGYQWAIREDWRSTDSFISTYAAPIVGDLDGDGIPEIVVAKIRSNFSAGDNGPNFRDFEALYVYKGSDRSTPMVINVIGNFMPAGVMAMARVPVGSDTLGLVVVIDSAGFLRAYNPFGPTPNTPLWTSKSKIIANYNRLRDYGSVAFADFNNDGHPEIYVCNRIFDAETGKLLVEGPAGGNKGVNTQITTGIQQYMPTVFDVDGDGTLEYIAGTEVYKVILNSRTDSTLNRMDLLLYIPSLQVDTVTIKDGITLMADINGDGRADVLVFNAVSQRRDFIAWDLQTKTLIAKHKIEHAYPEQTRAGIPFVGDIDNDGMVEILMTLTKDSVREGGRAGGHLYAFRWMNGTQNFDRVYHTATSDRSGCTGITLFDFNQSGKARLVYRDETQLRIMVAENDTFRNEATYQAISGTYYEYPVVADVDNDGAAEIVVVGADRRFLSDNEVYGTLRIYKSGNEFTWAPARKVWNQYTYNVVNINEDLTVPLYRMDITTLFPNGKRPFNNFLQQQTLLNTQGNMFNLTPNIIWDGGDPIAVLAGDSVVFTGRIKNIGEAALQKPFYFTFYKNDTLPVSNVIAMDSIFYSLPKDSTYDFRIVLHNISLHAPFARIWISVNDFMGNYPYQAQCMVDGRHAVTMSIRPLEIRAFLQGALAPTGDTMTTYAQWGGYLFNQPSLPTTDPYGMNATYTQINNISGTADKVVDWVRVEIWSQVDKVSPYEYFLVDSQALLLKPNGLIVDTNGHFPIFVLPSDSMHIVIKHRNHLSIMSKSITNFSTDTIRYDFSAGVGQAYKHPLDIEVPMVEQGTLWSLPAGDIDTNGIINALDMSIIDALLLDFNAGGNVVNTYRTTDVTLDGVVDATDARIVQQNVHKGVVSPVRRFQRKN
jgi:hypothetical protein